MKRSLANKMGRVLVVAGVAMMLGTIAVTAWNTSGPVGKGAVVFIGAIITTVVGGIMSEDRY